MPSLSIPNLTGGFCGCWAFSLPDAIPRHALPNFPNGVEGATLLELDLVGQFSLFRDAFPQEFGRGSQMR